MSKGKVYLVGAGPGDPELLTLKAVRVLGEADVVLHDDLVSDEVLEHVRPGARIVAVGKRGGCRSTPQEFIERLMVAEARRGQVVVRLKGGDPLVFGRGAEECATLRRHRIEHEVVNGITAVVAAASALGCAVTHRAVSHGAVLVTGHDPSCVDWRALAATGMPLAIYMAASRLEELQASLLAAGFPASTPAGIVMAASRPQQRTLVTRLGALAADAQAAAVASPAVVMLGDVVGSDAVSRVRAAHGAADGVEHGR